MNKRNLCLVVAIIVAAFPCLAFAQSIPAACLTACAEYSEGLAEDDVSTTDEIIAHCVTLPACVGMSVDHLRGTQSFCDSVFRDRTTPVVAPSAERRTPPAFCILPDGSTADDDRCGCPEGTYPIAVSAHRSRDRLRSLRVPRGHSVFVCYDPLAPRSAPGSADERRDALASTVEAHDAALRALCAPGEGETLAAACTVARSAFLVAGSTSGPVDLSSVTSAIENLTTTVETQRREIDAAVTSIEAVSDRVTGVVAEARDAGREAAETIGREAGRDAAREEVARSGGSRSDNFAMLRAYGLTTFNSLRYANADYDVLFAFGAELSFGIGLGGGWNVHGGIGVGYGGPDLPGVTNVQGAWHAGFGAWVDPAVMIGFGVLGTHRFRPDVFSVHSVYGPYLDATFRFSPRAEWTPVATIRGFVGASPRWNGSVWNVEADGGLMALLGIAHF